MKDCKRQMGPHICEQYGEGVCAVLQNENINGGRVEALNLDGQPKEFLKDLPRILGNCTRADRINTAVNNASKSK